MSNALAKYRSIPFAGILTISTFPTKHNIFVISRLKFGETCRGRGTCLATNDNIYHCIIGSPVSKSKGDKEKENYKGGWVEQWLLHRPVKQQVSGSNPGGGKLFQ